MKIVHVFWSLTIGGIETMLVNIANAQIELGAEIHVIIVNDLIDESLIKAFSPKVKIHLLGRKRHSKSPHFIKDLNNKIEEINPDCIHLHASVFYRLLSKKNLKRRVSLTLHDMPTGQIRHKGILYRLFPIYSLKISGNVRYIDKIPTVFAISKSVHDKLKEKYGINSMVINNGIHTEYFQKRPSKIWRNKIRIVQVSRLEHDKKGQNLLIQAASEIDNVDVDFIGEGESILYLKNLVKELNISDRVHFLGLQQQQYIQEQLKNYDIFVQPSIYEGFGLTVAEAMAAQVPVLVSEGQGPAEITCNDKYGWIFENGNIKDLVRVIKYIIEHYDEALMKVSIGRQYVLDNYDVSITAKKYLESYGENTKNI